MSNQRTLRAAFCLLLGLSMPSCTTAPVGTSGRDTPIRVALLKDAPEARIKVRGAYRIQGETADNIVEEGRVLDETVFRSQDDKLQMDGRPLFVKRVRVVPSKDVAVMIRGKYRQYRGVVDIVATGKGELLVINELDLEDYINGVLYHEISHRWPMAAMKAQAVAARSYAVYQSRTNRSRMYDVTNDVYSQVYGGRSSEKYRTRLAVERTAGEVLMYNGEVLPTYFHASCGGHTEDAGELWNHEGLRPLWGNYCGFCRLSPHYSWKRNFQSSAVQEKLNAAGMNLGLIKDIAVTDRTRSGRVRTLTITTRDGKTAEISGKKFRLAVGPDLIKSNKFDIEMKGYFFDLTGNGWGHGVGLCQWGAYGMSLQRYDYRQILDYYYPGSTLKRLSRAELSR